MSRPQRSRHSTSPQTHGAELKQYRVGRFPSSIGALSATFSERGLTRLEFSASAPRKPEGQLMKELTAYFKGKARVFRTRLDLASGTPFQRRVWEELRRIPFGTTTSYGELARRVGKPKAARAVGQAVGANPIPIVIPCHRVIRSNGDLGGYVGGQEIKKWLLRLEGCL